MGTLKGPSNAGQGGKRGHSNMEHWEFTKEIKLAARTRRRQEAKREVKDGWAQHQAEDGLSQSSVNKEFRDD